MSTMQATIRSGHNEIEWFFRLKSGDHKWQGWTVQLADHMITNEGTLEQCWNEANQLTKNYLPPGALVDEESIVI